MINAWLKISAIRARDLEHKVQWHRVGQSTRPRWLPMSSVRALARPGSWLDAEQRPRRDRVNTSAYRHCCPIGVTQRRDDQQSAVSRGLSVSARYVPGADANPRFRRSLGRAAALGCRLDLLGCYLATAVLAYVLCRQHRPRNPIIADESKMAAVAYALGRWGRRGCHAIVAPTLMHA